MARSSFSHNHSASRRPWWLVLLILAAGWIYNRYFQPQPPPEGKTPAPGRRPTTRPPQVPDPNLPLEPGGQRIQDVVIKAYDGDTVTLQRLGSTRLIGVDCPERAQPGGKEAGEFTRRTLLNQQVLVELCAKQPNDRYGRNLAFIYVSEGGRPVLFNRELVRQGYARVYSVRPCTVDEDAWNADYQEARSARRGLFGRLGYMPDAAAYRKRKRAGSTTD